MLRSFPSAPAAGGKGYRNGMNPGGTVTSGAGGRLAGLLSSQVRARVLTWSLTHPDISFSLTEMSRALDLAVSSVQHECYKLLELGLYRVRRDGASRRYVLQAQDPLVPGLRDLVVAEVGLPVAIRDALIDLPGLSAATLLGDVPARRDATALVLIGELDLDTVELAHRRVCWLIDAPEDAVELVFFLPGDWLARRDAGHPLVRRLLDLSVRAAFGEVQADETGD